MFIENGRFNIRVSPGCFESFVKIFLAKAQKLTKLQGIQLAHALRKDHKVELRFVIDHYFTMAVEQNTPVRIFNNFLDNIVVGSIPIAFINNLDGEQL